MSRADDGDRPQEPDAPCAHHPFVERLDGEEPSERADVDAAKVAVHLGLHGGLSIEAEMHTAGSSGPLLPAAFAVLIASLAHLCLGVGMAAAAVWAGAPDYLCLLAGAAGLGAAWLLTRNTLRAAGTVPFPATAVAAADRAVIEVVDLTEVVDGSGVTEAAEVTEAPPADGGGTSG
ncbi:hypothetical protein [Kitasatospora sp. NPDC088346]|uniref:hypothetical protein n=1 Tax=Kitasatospora sp. NPDC088346 TaxID=3364073 RepID=UPI00380D4884